jgi:Transposase, Mutator family
VRIFPNAESCLRLIRALAVEMHENWLEAHRYLNMDDLREYPGAVMTNTCYVLLLDIFKVFPAATAGSITTRSAI